MDRYRAYIEHVNPSLGKFLELSGRDLKLLRARGCVLEDVEGRRYDDWIAGFGSLNLGHNPDALKETLRRHLETDAPNLFVSAHSSVSVDRYMDDVFDRFEANLVRYVAGEKLTNLVDMAALGFA